MRTTAFSMILCEGYHDRAFLASALVHRLAFAEPPVDERGNRLPLTDAWGRVTGPDFGFRHRLTGAEVRVRPVHGHTKMHRAIQDVLKLGKPLDRLVICYDGDKGGNGGDFLKNIHKSIVDVLNGLQKHPREVSEGHWTIHDGTCEVRALVWHCNDLAHDDIPNQQCLERLLCASVQSVWPERTASVGAWLRDRPEPTVRLSSDSSVPSETIAKSYAWGLMAGWFAEHGCDDFHRIIWQHDGLAEALEARLDHAGGRSILAACCERPDVSNTGNAKV